MKPRYADQVIEVSYEEALGLTEMGVKVGYDWPYHKVAGEPGFDDLGYCVDWEEAFEHGLMWVNRMGSFFFVPKEPDDAV